MGSPYDDLPERAFWRVGVAQQPAEAVADLYQPKVAITPETRVMTAGSCFAQHVHRNLVARGWNVVDTETPLPALPRSVLARFSYGLYSARYGNIYTTRQLLQLIREAYGDVTPADPVWEKGGRFYDAQRPTIEPDGFDSADHVLEARGHHLEAVRNAIETTEVFVFTLGLTEHWRHRASGTVYPTAPGTLAGQYDPQVYEFHNLTVPEILADLTAVRAILKALRPDLAMLLTVSPVPLTATAAPMHVLQSTTYSKAVLRAAAGEFSTAHEDVDYFPSYELITSPAAGDRFFAPNLRSVTDEGVAAAMRMFFDAHDPENAGKAPPVRAAPTDDGDDDVVCEEALLDAVKR